MSNDRLTIAMAAARILTEARDFLKENRGHWIQGKLYEGIDGQKADGSLATAPRVCAMGAVLKAANLGTGHHNKIAPDEHTEAFEALRVLAGTIQGDLHDRSRRMQFSVWSGDIWKFNDGGHRSHKSVVDAFDRAVEHQCSVVRDLAAQTDLPLEQNGKKDHTS